MGASSKNFRALISALLIILSSFLYCQQHIWWPSCIINSRFFHVRTWVGRVGMSACRRTKSQILKSSQQCVAAPTSQIYLTSYTGYQEAPDCSKESAIWSVVTNPAEIKKDDEFMNVCVCNISTDADRIDVPLAEIASISSKQTSRELPPLWYSLKMQNEKKILHFECFWNHLKRTGITCRDH